MEDFIAEHTIFNNYTRQNPVTNYYVAQTFITNQFTNVIEEYIGYFPRLIRFNSNMSYNDIYEILIEFYDDTNQTKYSKFYSSLSSLVKYKDDDNNYIKIDNNWQHGIAMDHYNYNTRIMIKSKEVFPYQIIMEKMNQEINKYPTDRLDIDITNYDLFDIENKKYNTSNENKFIKSITFNTITNKTVTINNEYIVFSPKIIKIDKEYSLCNIHEFIIKEMNNTIIWNISFDLLIKISKKYCDNDYNYIELSRDLFIKNGLFITNVKFECLEFIITSKHDIPYEISIDTINIPEFYIDHNPQHFDMNKYIQYQDKSNKLQTYINNLNFNDSDKEVNSTQLTNVQGLKSDIIKKGNFIINTYIKRSLDGDYLYLNCKNIMHTSGIFINVDSEIRNIKLSLEIIDDNNTNDNNNTDNYNHDTDNYNHDIDDDNNDMDDDNNNTNVLENVIFDYDIDIIETMFQVIDKDVWNNSYYDIFEALFPQRLKS